MPTIRLINPLSRRRHAAKRRTRRRADRIAGYAGLGGNVSKRRVHHRRRRNPMFGSHRRRHRRNPIISMPAGDLLEMTAYGLAGFIGARAIPQALLGASNAGIMGYGANGVATVALSWLLGKVSPKAGSGALIGGSIATVARILSDMLGQQAFGGALGDLQYDLGFYINNTFPVPTTGQGPYLLNPGVTGQPTANGGVQAPIVITPASSSPTAQAAAAATGGDNGGGGRWANRWAA